MNTSYWRGGAAAAAGFLLASCASMPIEQKAPPVALLHGGNAGALAAGRQLYVGKCTKCHIPEAVAAHSEADWKDDIIPRMVKKAKLTPEEAASLLAYVLAARPVALATPAAG